MVRHYLDSYASIPNTSGVYIRTIFHDTKAKFPYTPVPASATTATAPDPSFPVQPPESTDYEAGLTVIGEFDTVEEFCRYFNWLKPPSKLERNSNYHLFKSGIKPMWEDEANANGGKWVLTMKNSPVLLDRCWSWLAMALVGEELEEGDEICGAVVSLRSKVDRIQVWTRSKDDVEKLNGIGKRLVKLLDISEVDNIGLEFQVGVFFFFFFDVLLFNFLLIV
jgi:translation initiation factor 4E